jgi:hypothetical protein
MTAILKVDTIQDTSGNNIISESSDTITIGASGDTTNIIGTLQNNGSALSSGITEADQWRWNAHFTGDATPITANWERNDTNFDKIGTGMSESSGVFTFPSTGIYKIDSYTLLSLSGTSRYSEYIIKLSTDGGSNYNQSAYGYSSIFNDSATVYTHNYASTIIDVTNVSNFKVTISITHQNTSTLVRGNTDFNTNATTFIRLGDT